MKGSASLSRRQAQVLSCREEGLSYKEIAARLGISISTVKAHLKKVFVKVGARSSAQAVFIQKRGEGARNALDAHLAPGASA